MNETKDIILKIGITPSEAPFRITCLRTFLYIYAIAEKNGYLGGKSKIVFQIDDTNISKRRHSNEEIIEFYKKIGIIPFKYSEMVLTSQTDLTYECEKYFDILKERRLIIHNDDNTYSFDIKKYMELYGSNIEVNDKINGTINFNAKNLTNNESIIIRRSDGSFLYNFSSAIDTIHWQFTTLIRGNNKMSSAAFQNMYIKALGYETPDYFHLPLLLEEAKHNDYGINARSDIRELFKNGFSYMPVINYLLNTGYGDQTDNYFSIEDFNKKFDISKLHKDNAHFDFNIMRKTCNRFYQQKMTYEEYCDQLIRHINLMEWPEEIMKYSTIGYEYGLSPQKISQLYIQLSENHFDEIMNDSQKKQILLLIESLLQDYDKTIETILSDKDHKKENLRLVKFILSGYFDGLMCDVYKKCYDEKKYKKRLKYVKDIIS